MNLRTIILILLISVALMSLDRFKIFDPAKRLSLNLYQPAQIGFDRLIKKLGTGVSTVVEISKLRDRNRELEYNSALLTAENTRLKNLEAENVKLKEQIGLNFKNDKLILASPAGFSTIGSVKYMMINKGSDDGVKKDKLVILRDILIGKIIDTTPASSNVLMVTDPEFKAPVITTSKARGLLVGQYLQDMKLTKVLPEEKLGLGDIVTTSGEAGFPSGLVIGKIEQVIKGEKEIFQEALVKPLLNLEKLELVFVVS